MIIINMDTWSPLKAKSLFVVIYTGYFYFNWLRFNFYVISDMSRAKMNFVRQKIQFYCMVTANVWRRKMSIFGIPQISAAQVWRNIKLPSIEVIEMMEIEKFLSIKDMFFLSGRKLPSLTI